MGRGGGVGIGEREEHIHAEREGDGGREGERAEDEMEEGMSHLQINKKNKKKEL